MSTVDSLLKWLENRNNASSAVGALSGLTLGQDSYNSYGNSVSGLDDQINYLSAMYNPNGAVAQQYAKELAAKDAAAGRNSQYGVRSALLQAKLAQGATQNATTIANLMAQKQKALAAQQQTRAAQLGQLWDFANKTGATDWLTGQLKDLWNTSSSNQGTSQYSLDQGNNQYQLPQTSWDSPNLYDISVGSQPGVSSNDQTLIPSWGSEINWQE